MQTVELKADTEVAYRAVTEVRKKHTYYWFEICYNGVWYRHQYHEKNTVRFLNSAPTSKANATTIPTRKSYDERRWADVIAKRFVEGKSGWGLAYLQP